MKKIILTIYLVLQLTLYLLAVFIDNNLPTNVLEYSIIIINFLFVGYLTSIYKTKDSLITLLALLFTLVADTFLVLLGNHLTIAMISFSIVQIFYFYKIKNINQIKLIKKDLIRLVTIALVILVIFIISIKNLDLLILFTAFYFLMLLFNFIDSLKTFKKYPSFSIGLLLFILCDIFVGLGFLQISLPVSIPFDLVWFFYAPSQVLLATSILFINKTKAEIV